MILVVGNLSYDVILPLDRLPGPHEKIACDEAILGYGGSAANTAYWLARLGNPVALAGAVGRDPLGTGQLEELKSAGVYVNAVDRVNAASGLAVVFAHGTEKRMVRSLGANREGKFHPDALLGCRLMYLSGANADLAFAYASAAPTGCRVFGGGKSLGDERILRTCHGAILNADELVELTGLDDLAEGLQALDLPEAAVTLPEGGCLVSRGIEVNEVSAPYVEPVDRTGAGDAFAAGYLAGAALEKEPETCGRWGNLMAARVLMGWGARPKVDLPDLEG